MLHLTGIHHVSALTNDIRGSHDFATHVLGLRLVKRTVNQDDPRMYHLVYGDALGTPGTGLTLFDLPRAAREHRGSRSIARTTFRVGGEPALAFWSRRLTEHRVDHSGVVTRDGRAHLDFEDPSGLIASLVDDGGRGEAHPWPGSPVPAEHQIRGLGYSVLAVPDLDPTHAFLTDLLSLTHTRTYAHPDAPEHLVHVYRMHADGPAGELHVAVRPDLTRARYGAGGVHHVALRVPDDAQYHAWTTRLTERQVEFSGEVDRHYFRSLYVREPGGVMIELATDGPGFQVDEPLDRLGQTLALPPFLNARRTEIAANLGPID